MENCKNSQEYMAGRAAAEWWQTLSEEQRKQMDIVDAYAYGVLHGWNNPHWISVEEYPKVDISCTLLVHYVDGTIDICDYYGDFYDYTGENVTRNVTHWMPMPEAPRKEDKK